VIVGCHIIFGAYGFWLPYDPRGSWWEFVGSLELLQYGPATKTTEKKSLAYREHDRASRLSAKTALKYPPVQFDGLQARAVARGFANYFERTSMSVWSCAILPDHVHMVIGKPALPVEQLVIQLKGKATEQLVREGLHPMARYAHQESRAPKCWVRGQWKVYLDPPDIPRAIRYVQENPVKAGLRKQEWSFVVPFSG